jgi:hypothetical protein
LKRNRRGCLPYSKKVTKKSAKLHICFKPLGKQMGRTTLCSKNNLSKLFPEDGLATLNRRRYLSEDSIISNSPNRPTHSYNYLHKERELKLVLERR